MVCMGCGCTLPHYRVGFLTHGPDVPRGTWNQGLLEGLGHIGTGYVKGQTQVMISRGFTGFVRSNKTRPFGMSLNVFGIFLYRFVGILRRRMLDSGNHSTLF